MAPFIFWGTIVAVAAGGTFVANRRKRKKYAQLAAHMTQSGVSDPSMTGSLNSNVGIASAGAIDSVASPHNAHG